MYEALVDLALERMKPKTADNKASVRILQIAQRFSKLLQVPLTLEMLEQAYSIACDYEYTPTLHLNEAHRYALHAGLIGEIAVDLHNFNPKEA